MVRLLMGAVIGVGTQAGCEEGPTCALITFMVDRATGCCSRRRHLESAPLLGVAAVSLTVGGGALDRLRGCEHSVNSSVGASRTILFAALAFRRRLGGEGRSSGPWHGDVTIGTSGDREVASRWFSGSGDKIEALDNANFLWLRRLTVFTTQRVRSMVIVFMVDVNLVCWAFLRSTLFLMVAPVAAIAVVRVWTKKLFMILQ